MIVVIVSVDDHRHRLIDIFRQPFFQPVGRGRKLGIDQQHIVSVFNYQRVAAAGRNGLNSRRQLDMLRPEVCGVKTVAHYPGRNYQQKQDGLSQNSQ